MDEAKRKRLEEKGWKVGTVAVFLGLSPEEEAVVELRVQVARSVRERREARGITQADLARRIGSTQSKVARLENLGTGVSLDQYFKALFALGVRVELVVSDVEPAPDEAPRTAQRAATRREPAGKAAAKGGRVAVRAKGK